MLKSEVYDVFAFEKEQKVWDINGVKIGGQPGAYPTVLIGSIFYDKHKIVSDRQKGIFDKKKAEELINKQDEMSDKTGNPCILDIVGDTAEALEKHIDFVASVTKAPFLVDSTLPDARLAAIKYAVEAGLVERAIYNSIDVHSKESELNTLKELGVKSSMILVFSPKALMPEGRIELLKGAGGEKGLIQKAQEAGIKNMLVDTAVLDVVSISFAAQTIYSVKNEFGLPSGCGPANAITAWKKIKKEFPPASYKACISGSVLVTAMVGADFALYGPIEEAESVFPACAMVNGLVAYYNKRKYRIRQEPSHPLNKIF
nr:tetrahydromethanopterin S-methyltransferase subunit H [Candidatus Freyarchaeota archaeon]